MPLQAEYERSASGKHSWMKRNDAIAALYNGQQLEIDQVTDGVTVHIRCGRAAPRLYGLTLVIQAA